MLLKNGINLSGKLIDFIEQSESLFIYVPYIKLEPLKKLLANNNSCTAIFVRWETKDLILGSSDIEIYNYCKLNGIALYRNRKLHLKAFVNNYKSAIIGSANISSRALNIPESNNFNYELANEVSNLDIEDRLYFSTIEHESTLITDSIYNQLLKQIPEKKIDFPDETEFEISLEAEKDFLISALPLTYNVETLIRIYNEKKAINETEFNCAIHDLAIYNLQFGLQQIEFLDLLKISFFNHPFIKAFLNKVNEKGEIYFGESKAWIHANCSDVPLPRRFEITDNIQVLYKWIEYLSDGKYKVDRPNYSERLYKKN
jgi:hypothetical protein